MAEAFGLDRKIENYQGKRPIGFYRWDLDCLDDVISMAVDDTKEYPDKSGIPALIQGELFVICQSDAGLRNPGFSEILFSNGLQERNPPIPAIPPSMLQ